MALFMALALMSFILPVITGILAFMAFISPPPIYGGLGMGRYGGGRGKNVININIYI
jgi:hypothetical protein